VIAISLTPSALSSSKTNVPKNPVTPLKKGQDNIVRPLIVAGNRSACRKNLPNTADARFVPDWRDTIENGRAVTTAHLFWPNQRRKAARLLPIWLRNFDSVRRRDDQEGKGEKREGGGGHSLELLIA